MPHLLAAGASRHVLPLRELFRARRPLAAQKYCTRRITGAREKNRVGAKIERKSEGGNGEGSAINFSRVTLSFIPFGAIEMSEALGNGRIFILRNIYFPFNSFVAHRFAS